MADLGTFSGRIPGRIWVRLCVAEHLMNDFDGFSGFWKVRVLWRVKNDEEVFAKVFGGRIGLW